MTTPEDPERYWECPPESKRSAREWVAEQEKPPVEEFRKTTRPVFQWYDVEPVGDSAVDAEVVRALADLRFRPRWRYKSKSARGVAGVAMSGDGENQREHWCSDDGITTGIVEVGAGDWSVIGFDTRFQGGVLVSMPREPSDPKPQNEYLTTTGDPIEDYQAHRRRVAQRIEAGEVALSMGDESDRIAWSDYYADYLSGRELAEMIETLRSASDVYPNEGCGWRSLVIAAILAAVVVVLAVAAVALVGDGGVFLDWLKVWWPIALVAVAPSALTRYAVLLFTGHLNYLDHKYPDSFDEHAGYWLKERIQTEGLADRVEVGKAKEPLLNGLDAYLPFRKKIVLGEKTYEKQDPTFWAIAAHELGHAVDYDRREALRPLSIGSRVMMNQLMGWVYAGLLVNTLFGWAFADETLRWLIILTLACGVVVLFDEAIASIIGLRILRSDRRLDSEMLRDMRRHLALAFATYCSPLLVFAALLAGWHWVADYIETHASFQPAEPMIPGRTSLGNVLSFALLVTLLFTERQRLRRWFDRLRGARAPEPEPTEEEKGPLTLFCAKCGKRYPRGVDECPEDGTLLVDVGFDGTSGESETGENSPEEDDDDTVDLSELGKGCIGLVVLVAVAIAFALEVWDQPLGDSFRAAVFVFSPLVTLLFAPVIVPIGLLLQLPTVVARWLKLVPKPPEQTAVQRASAAAADVVAEVPVLDPRTQSPWYLDLVSPGMLLHALPLIVLWWAAQF